jgi:2,3-dihydroxyphenylpropionate 1,2-dioxygenase
MSQAMPRVMLGCSSHSPLIKINPVETPDARAIEMEIAAFQEQVERFNPDYIVMFANDHFANFHYSNMPAYCVGTAAEAINDIGGVPGKMPAATEDAITLVEHVRKAGFDPAISYKMMVDHGFSQPLARLVGAIDRYPFIPIFTSVFTRPLIPYRRSRQFGEAVGRFIAESGKRVLIMAGGGISHEVEFIYPSPGNASPEIYGWQLDGDAGGGMTATQWFQRLDEIHHEGVAMINDGRLTAKDLRLNPVFDRDFLKRLSSGNLKSMDEWDQAEVVAKAGIGGLEIHGWIAARAAFTAAGGGAVETSYYQMTDYGVGYGFARSVA